MTAAPHLKQFQFKAGKSGNPTGITSLPPELRAIKSLTPREVARVIAKFWRLDIDTLQTEIKGMKLSVGEMAIASIFANAIKHGEEKKLNFLLDRAIGRIQVAEEHDEDIIARQELQGISTEELIRMMRERVPGLKETG